MNLFQKMAKIEKIKLKEYISPAKRSPFSLLDCTESLKLLNFKKIKWQNALRDEIIFYKKQFINNTI